MLFVFRHSTDTLPTAHIMPRIQTAFSNTRIKNLMLRNIKSYLSTATNKRGSMDKAGRKFLLTIILKNSGTQNLFKITSTCSPRGLTVLKCLNKTPSETLGYTAAEFATCLGVNKKTVQKYANSKSAFQDIIPSIEKKKAASNRWEAREVNVCMCIMQRTCTQCIYILFVSLFSQDGPVILRTITHDWASNLTPSAKKNDFVFKCVREAGAHQKITINGVSSYECVPGKGCQKHQRHFQAHSTALLFRMFCKGHPGLATIVTEYIYRKMRPFFASKPTLR